MREKTKRCSKCGNEKLLSNFGKHKGMKDGLRPMCKECRKKESKTYYLSNKKRIAKQHKNYRKNNKDKIKERIKRWANSDIFRYWASCVRRNHKPKFRVDITLAELTKKAKEATHCPICNIKLDYSLYKKKPFPNTPSLDRKNKRIF
jgi:hypothetical protein